MISRRDAERVASYIIPQKVVHGGRYDIDALGLLSLLIF